MEPQTNYNYKKIIFFVAGGTITIIFLLWLWHFFTTGKIIITTHNTNNTITLTKESEDKKSSPAKTYSAHGKLALSLPTGEYIVYVQGNSVATTQIVKLNGHKTQTYSIDPINTSGVEPVTYQNAQNLAANVDELVYLNKNNGLLYKIDGQNNLTKLSSSTQLQSVKWANTSLGIGQTKNGNFYIINGGSISPLKVPFSYTATAGSFAITPDQQVYISNGADVYAGSLSGNFKKIYTATTSTPTIAAGKDEVAVADEVSERNTDQKPLLAIMTTSGKTVKKNQDAGYLYWSPSGRYLASVDETGTDIYDTSLNLIVNIPAQSFIGQLQWLDDNTLFYSVNDQLWTYSLPTEKSQLIANMPLANTISGIAISGDRSYVYVSTSDTRGSDTAIRRIGLKGQKTADLIFQLQDILPKDLSDCTLSLVNFSNQHPPSVIAIPFPDSNLGIQAYLNEARTELQQDGFDLNKLHVELGAHQ